MQRPMTDPDASGGLGSFQTGALGILTGLINTVGIPYVAKELNLTETTDASGNTRYAAAPTQQSTAQQAKSLLTHPLVLIGGAALLAFIAWRALK